MIGALGVVAAVREARLVEARAASTVGALLGLRTGLVDAGEQALPIDADAGLTALEVELAQGDRRVGVRLGEELRFGLGRTQAQTVDTRRTDHAVLFFGALADAPEIGAELTDRAVDFVHADGARGSGLLFAGIPAADEAATIADRPVCDAKVPGVVVAAEEAEES
ncbi:MAG: hypothetical protein OES69_01875 [Myxococcales bacterium]|nr:hypothetical protein [Myxococcales bacterium]MDH3842659.1 hypothetical protein [Myxococcales bacterium]